MNLISINLGVNFKLFKKCLKIDLKKMIKNNQNPINQLRILAQNKVQLNSVKLFQQLLILKRNTCFKCLWTVFFGKMNVRHIIRFR